MKFRKKPITIEAEQFHGGHPETWPEGVVAGFGEYHYQVITLEGPFVVSVGGWIITGVKGERYPCRPDIFEATYDPVED